MPDLGLIRHLLLALAQKENLIKQSGAQGHLIIDALAKHMPIHLHAAHEEVDVTRPNSQPSGFDALAAHGLHSRGQLEVVLLENLDQSADDGPRVLRR